jgi:glucose/mannose-6-phosphate isomerase
MSANPLQEPMKSYLYGLPEQFTQCLELNYEELERYRKPYQNLMISGLGGSAIGGDILRTYAFEAAALPVYVNRGYELPRFVDNNTLFIAVSYSGNTEETLTAYEQAKARGADILVISSGGTLTDHARNDGYPLVAIPGGLSPRAATGYLLAPLLLSLQKAGILKDARSDIEETAAVLFSLRDLLQPGRQENNLAMSIAAVIKDAIPIIWGSVNHTEAAALRWKAQINENAKSPAYYNVFPELNHNEIVGFEAPQQLLSQLAVIILRDSRDHQRVQQRMEITRGVIESKVKKVVEVESAGESLLARIYSLIYIGDYVSYYLALEYGIDPTPVKVIDYLKAELAGSGS